MKKSFLLAIMLIAGMSIYGIAIAQNTELSLDIIAGRIAIDSSGNITIGSITTNSSPTEITGTFSSNSFRTIDLRGGPGFYTTIQFGDLIKGIDRIANTNIQLKTIAAPNIIEGDNNNYMRFGSGIGNQFNTVNQPMTYFVRKSNEQTGEIGKFGDMPDIKIIIPANQTGGTYTGTVYYTLYDME